MNAHRVKSVAGLGLLFVLCVTLLCSGWYVGSRLLRGLNAVRAYELEGVTGSFHSAAPGQLRVAAWNIAHGRGGDLGASNWRGGTKAGMLAHLGETAAQVHAVDADVVVLNEVDIACAWSFHVNQAKYIAERAGYAHVAEQRNMDVSFPFWRFRFGNAILSRWPIRDVRFLDLPPLSRWEDVLAGNHDALFAVADTPAGPVALVAVHLEHRCEAIRVDAAHWLVDFFEGLSLPVILAGDFNSTPGAFPVPARRTPGSTPWPSSCTQAVSRTRQESPRTRNTSPSLPRVRTARSTGSSAEAVRGLLRRTLCPHPCQTISCWWQP